MSVKSEKIDLTCKGTAKRLCVDDHWLKVLNEFLSSDPSAFFNRRGFINRGNLSNKKRMDYNDWHVALFTYYSVSKEFKEVIAKKLGKPLNTDFENMYKALKNFVNLLNMVRRVHGIVETDDDDDEIGQDDVVSPVCLGDAVASHEVLSKTLGIFDDLVEAIAGNYYSSIYFEEFIVRKHRVLGFEIEDKDDVFTEWDLKPSSAFIPNTHVGSIFIKSACVVPDIARAKKEPATAPPRTLSALKSPKIVNLPMKAPQKMHKPKVATSPQLLKELKQLVTDTQIEKNNNTLEPSLLLDDNSITDNYIMLNGFKHSFKQDKLSYYIVDPSTNEKVYCLMKMTEEDGEPQLARWDNPFQSPLIQPPIDALPPVTNDRDAMDVIDVGNNNGPAKEDHPEEADDASRDIIDCGNCTEDELCHDCEEIRQVVDLECREMFPMSVDAIMAQRKVIRNMQAAASIVQMSL